MTARTWRRIRQAYRSGGLTRRAAVLSVLVSLVIGGAFAVLVVAINDLRDTADLTSKSRQVLAAADQLQTSVIDIETGERGFVITGKARFLEPWYKAREAFPGQASAFERLARSGDLHQGVRAHAIVQAAAAYIHDYSVPTVAAARRDPASVRTVAVTEQGKELVDSLRGRFARFVAFERDILAERQDHAAGDAQRAAVMAAAGVGGSIVLILGFGAYMNRSVVRPIRGASVMAGRVAGGDLTVRMPETGPAEIGKLQRAFNTMAGSLEVNRDELRRVADEQAALQRVATLVARGVTPPEVFGAVAREMGSILQAACTAVNRYEPDGAVTVVGSWSAPGAPDLALPVGSRWPLERESVSERVLATGRPARMATYASASSQIAAWARRRGIDTSVGSPVKADGRVWGVVIAFWGGAEPHADGIEQRMLGFTELAATAIANAESRAELTASRARVVAAADETRRRIERDLHDGAQQRLISLGLELREAELGLPPGHDTLKQQISQAIDGLSDVVAELQELSRGLHPAILSQGGLGPALRGLARRSAVPAELNLSIGRRLPERGEVAAYYIVSEALTNVAKHARASLVRIDVRVEGGVLRVSVRDDGVGGADPGRGSGLIGLRDRVEALGGSILVTSPPGGGTSLAAAIPAGEA